MLYAVQGDGPTTFVADRLSSVGGDPITRTAVNGALMQCGVEVMLMDGPLKHGWYQRSVRALGFENVAPVMDGLLARRDHDC